MDGGAIADATLLFDPRPPADPAPFRKDMAAIFAAHDRDSLRQKTQVVVAEMMDAVRRHG
jgi:hypothetical protein